MAFCGGLLSAKQVQIPLKGVDVEVHVRDHVATLACVLEYENGEDVPTDAVFAFPLSDRAAVCHFSASVGESELVAKVQDTRKALEEYYGAVTSGLQAVFFEEREQSPDLFALSVGKLLPGESASVRLEYVTELAMGHDGGLRLCLPAALNPHYRPRGEHAAPAPAPALAPLASCSLRLSAAVSSPRPVSKVVSNCSLEPLQYLNAEQTRAVVRLAAGHRFDRDVELLFYYMHAHQPVAVVEKGLASASPGSLMGDPVVMLSFYPEFPETACGEFLFLIDRSDSMRSGAWRGSRMGEARDTLTLLLKSLPLGCYFNIYCFGKSSYRVFHQSVEYNRDTVERAMEEIELMNPDMGQGDILPPLMDIYGTPCIPGHPRQLFVFTCRAAENTEHVIDLVKGNAGSHRCFAFGIGEGASSALVNGMSEHSGGHAQLITPTERMQPKAMQSLRFSLQPCVTDIALEWNLPDGVSATPLSSPVTTLFSSQRALVYAQLTGRSPRAFGGSVKLSYGLAGRTVERKIRFGLGPPGDDGEPIVHRLGARAVIRSLEQRNEPGRWYEEDERRRRAVELSIQSGVSSAFTTYIAVNKASGTAVREPLLGRDVPVPGTLVVDRGATVGYDPACPCVEQEPPFLCLPAPRNKLLQLISLQAAYGSWTLTPDLGSVLGKSRELVECSAPAQVDQGVWSTVLALVWLHAFKADAREEWHLVAAKAVSWLCTQHLRSHLTVCVEFANALLGCSVQEGALGL